MPHRRPGASLVHGGAPMLSEVVFSGPANQRSFICGALSAKGDSATELGFARGRERHGIA